MFNVFKKKQKQGEEMKLKITGMHCTSCAINIDGELEEIDGVISASTSYAQAVTKINYDPEKVVKETLHLTIKKLGYSTEEVLSM